MILLLIFLFFVNSVITSEKWDKFFFHTSISCDFDHKSSFTYDIMFYESDTFIVGGLDDVITNNFEDQPLLPEGIVNRTYPGQMNGDEYFGNTYEPYAYITHDCLLTEEPVTVSIIMYYATQKCQVGKGDCHIYVNIDLTGLEGDEKREVRVEQGATH